MPKLKTQRGAAKRFKKTAGGKFLRSKAFKQHILTSKSSKRKRHMRGTEVVAKPTRPSSRGCCRINSSARLQPVAEPLVAEADSRQWETECRELKEEPYAGEAEEAARACQGLLREQEQAVSRGKRIGRYGAQVCVRRPPPQEARLPDAVDRPHQRRRARARPHLRPVHGGAQGGGHDARSEDAGRHRRERAGVVRLDRGQAKAAKPLPRRGQARRESRAPREGRQGPRSTRLV